MATQTTNLHLTKPATSDTVSIADINGNMDILDAALAIDNKNASLSWGTNKTLATIGSKSITVTMPSNPNSWRGFTTRTFAVNYSGVGSGNVKDCNFDISVSGYTPIAFSFVDTGDANALLTRFCIINNGTGANIRFKNAGSSTISGTVTIQVVYLQNG